MKEYWGSEVQLHTLVTSQWMEMSGQRSRLVKIYFAPDTYKQWSATKYATRRIKLYHEIKQEYACSSI